MSLFLLLNNLHFAVSLFGSFAFFMAAWLYLDAYLIKRESYIKSRSLGFLFVGLWFLFHALGLESNLFLSIGWLLYLVGLVLLLSGFRKEKLPPRPELAGVIVLPALVGWSQYVGALSAALTALLSVQIARRYFKDYDRTSKNLFIGFVFLTAGAVAALFNRAQELNAFWLTEHIFLLAGFIAVAFWVLYFLRLRTKEQSLTVFIAAALFISLLVTFTFSTLLLRNIETQARNNLSVNGKVFNFYLAGLSNQALALTQLVARNDGLVSAVNEKDFAGLQEVGSELIRSLNLGFLTIADSKGNVLVKAHFPSSRGDTILSETIGSEALEGRSAVTIGQGGTEGFSLRAAAPIYDRKSRLVGAVLSGFLLDNLMADNLKKITGLDTTVFSGEEAIASTVVGPDGITRIQRVKLTDIIVKRKVLDKGEEFVGQARFLGQETLGAFLPLKNAQGKAVGILATTKPQIELVQTANATNRLTIVVVLAIVVALIVPLYRFSKYLA